MFSFDISQILKWFYFISSFWLKLKPILAGRYMKMANFITLFLEEMCIWKDQIWK